MKNLYNIIFEKLIINANSKKKQYNPEELRKDYHDVEWAMTKAEKQVFAQKYGVNSNKYKDIQYQILLLLRELRQNKKEFDQKDINDFYRFDWKEKEFFDYLNAEPIDFIKYIFQMLEENLKKKGIFKWVGILNKRNFNYHISYADKNLLDRYEKIKKYLQDKGEL